MKPQKLFKADFLQRELIVICSLIFVLMSVGSVKADTPQLISYQAYITDSTGTPVNQTSNVTFNIWDDPVSGSSVWSETHVSVSIVSGNLTVLLGSVTPLDNSLFSDTGLYLGVQIGGDPELSPRSRLTSVPYSYRTGSIAGASGGSVSGAITISPDPAKATGDAIVILDGNNDTVMTTTTSVSNGVEVFLFDPVDSKDGFAVPSVMRVVISPTGIVMFDSTGIDTTVIIDSDGQILVGPNSTGAVASTVFGTDQTASGDTSTIGGGAYNIANSYFATVGGGRADSAIGSFSTIGGGRNNLALGFLSTIGGGDNNEALEFVTTVGGGVANSAADTAATVGGGSANAAGGFASTVGGGLNNAATDDYSTVSGGWLNAVSGPQASIGGGSFNVASGGQATISGGNSSVATGFGAFIGGGSGHLASQSYATIGGGASDTASNAYATVAGGALNSAGGYASTIGGGQDNRVDFDYSTIGGGNENFASASWCAIGGGAQNITTGNYSTVAGGTNDSAYGIGSMIPGGAGNYAGGNYSFAAGYRARAGHLGSFVWSDATTNAFSSSVANEFSVRATGGVRFYTNGTDTSGVTMGGGASAWSSVSDKNVKKEFRDVDSKELLEKLSEIPISRWKYMAEKSQADHIGPMAQDFYSAFGLGDDDKHISTIDADGVALAAIQALYEQNQELKKELEKLKKKLTELSGK